jgi:hypothetical protein
MSNFNSINVSYNGMVNFTSSSPQQQQFMLDTTNVKYLRYATLTQDSLTLTVYTSSAVIPLSQLYAAAVNVIPQITWPPIIISQPTSSAVTHSNAVYFVVNASAELPITYSWYYQSGSNFTWFPIVSTGSYTGSLTAALTCSSPQIPFANTASYRCVLSDVSGFTSSSIATLYTL